MTKLFILLAIGTSGVLAENGSALLEGAASSASLAVDDVEAEAAPYLRGEYGGSRHCYQGGRGAAGCSTRRAQYCQVGDGYCATDEWGIEGVCKRTNVGCSVGWNDVPVCGCDGNTYTSRCLAQQNGVNVLREGECGERCVIGQIPCKMNEYCKVSDGMCGTVGSEGLCVDLPELYACEYINSPVCGCDGTTYANRCEANGRGANVEHEGECVSDDTYIVNSGSPNQRVIQVDRGSCAAGTNVLLFHQTNQDFQKWVRNGDGTVESKSCPGMVLDIEGGSNSGCADGTNIILWNKSGSDWQKWSHDGGMLVSEYCPNMVIEIEGAEDANGANIQLGRKDGGWEQKWSFE